MRPVSWKSDPGSFPKLSGSLPEPSRSVISEPSGSFWKRSRTVGERSMLQNTMFLQRRPFINLSPTLHGSFQKTPEGMRCVPAHLYGAGVPARMLNTRPTRPGGGQVPGTPKDRVVYGADVLLPCASLAPGLTEQPQESRETSSCSVLRNVDTRPPWEQGLPPTDWWRLPFGVTSKVIFGSLPAACLR